MLRCSSMLALCLLCHAAQAQDVYKCTAGGKVSYGDVPCAGGRSAVLPAPAPASPAEAAARLKSQQALLAALRKERAAAEAQLARGAPRARAASAAARKRCDKLRLRHKWLEEDLRRAAGPATEPLRLKLRRRAEALAVECPA